MNYKKIVAFLLMAVVCLSLFASCGYNPKNVMNIDGVDIPAGKYLFLQVEAVNDAISAYGDDTVTGTAIYDVEIEGKPAREWINDRTLEKCKQFAFVENEFARLNLELDAISSYYASSASSQAWQSYSNVYMQNGISYQTFDEMYQYTYKQSILMSALYGAEGEMALPTADKEAYFAKNYTRADYIAFPKTDSFGYAISDDAAAAMKAVAEKFMAAKSEDELKTLFIENYGDVYAAIGSNTEANEDAFGSTFKSNAIVATSNTSFSKAFLTELFATTDNEYHVFDQDNEIVFYRVNGLGADDLAADYDASVVQMMAYEPFIEYLNASIANYEPEIDQKARNYYSLDKVVLEQSKSDSGFSFLQ